MRMSIGLISAVLLISCAADSGEGNESGMTEGRLRILALGDSYAMGQGVDPNLSWPAQLANLIRANEVPVENPVVVARDGWGAEDLLAALGGPTPRAGFGLGGLA